MEQCAREFYSQSEFLRNLDWKHFTENWTMLLNGPGIILLLFDLQGEIQGFLGGVKYPDINNNELVAYEQFWFVSQDFRGEGWRLYRPFERWARNSGCKQIQMVHLADSMPDRLAQFYENIGFKRTEIRYSKELTCP